MNRKLSVLLVVLLTLSIVLTACGGQQECPECPDVECPEAGECPECPDAECPECPECPAAPAAGEARLQIVKDRGKVVCGSRTDLLGFGYLDADGKNIGFDIDFCRAVAAAIFNDPEAVEFVPLTAAERGPALQTGEVDMLARTMTWTSTRDAQWGDFTWIMYYDGQGYMVPKDSGITTVEQLDGATICIVTGTTTELNLADDFRQRGLNFEAVGFEDSSSVFNAYEDGRCDATTSDKSVLVSVREGFNDPSAHIILDATISKEPLTPAVPHGDDQWFDIVKMVMIGLINAEEMGITQANVEEMKNNDDISVRRLLGTEGEWGQADLGLSADAIAKTIKGVGNYGEIYDRYMGAEALNIPRGPNSLWIDGGLVYAPPLR